MSSEWNDPEASWQQSNQPNWDEEYEDVASPPPDSGEEEDPDHPVSNTRATSQNAGSDVFMDNSADDDGLEDDLASDDDDEEDALAPTHSRFAAFQQFAEHLLPVFIPLLLVGCTFLFILPLVLRNHSYIHAAYLWPVGLIAVAVAILQGTILFYADTNDVYWSLAIGVGFCLFVLIGVFTVFGPSTAIILLLIFVVIGIVGMRLYMLRVHDEHVVITYAFGKYARTLYPGINFRMPWETISSAIATQVIVWTSPEQHVIMSRDEDVHLKVTVSYQLTPEDAHLVAQQPKQWEVNMQNLICNELQNIAGALSPDDFLIWPQGSRSQQRNVDMDEATRWEHINHMLFEKLRDKVALWGVQINWVQIRDITLTPRAVYAGRDAMENVTTVPIGGTAHYGSVAQSQPTRNQYSAIDLDNDTTERIETPVMSQAASSSGGFPQGNPAPAQPGKIPKEEVLIQAYRQVQMGKITSPAAIRDVAAKFEAVAANPVLNQSVSFNAVLAAQSLYERADMYERNASHTASPINDNETISMSMPSSMENRLPNDENLTSGG